jgi:hypothetical protein
MIHKILSVWDIKLLHVNKQEENTVHYQSICSFCLKYVGVRECHVCENLYSFNLEGIKFFLLGSKIKVAGKFQYRAKTNFTDCLLCKKCTLKSDLKYGNVLGKPRLIVGCSATDDDGGGGNV